MPGLVCAKLASAAINIIPTANIIFLRIIELPSRVRFTNVDFVGRIWPRSLNVPRPVLYRGDYIPIPGRIKNIRAEAKDVVGILSAVPALKKLRQDLPTRLPPAERCGWRATSARVKPVQTRNGSCIAFRFQAEWLP